MQRNANIDSINILIVDDEATIREVTRRYLEREGFSVEEAADGYQVLNILEEKHPDLIILDLMLPGIDGLSLARQIRKDNNVPIIMLTALGEPSDRIRGLDLGADDYMIKPFNPQELVSRVHAILRRSNKSGLPADPAIELDNLVVNPATHICMLANEIVSLSVKEFDLLWFFVNNLGRVFTRDQILEQVWGAGYYGDPTTVTVHIRRLREKIEDEPSKPKRLKTVWGVGYKFES